MVDASGSHEESGDFSGSETIAIGKIVRARGIRGELVVSLLTDFPERFAEMNDVLIEAADGEELGRYPIRSAKPLKSQIVLQLEGVETRNDAEDLVGCFLCISETELVELDENDFFQFEIVGMDVVSEDGEELGTVSEVMQFPANDVWRVEGEQEILLPAIKDVIKKVDRENRVVTVHLLEGLGGERKISEEERSN